MDLLIMGKSSQNVMKCFSKWFKRAKIPTAVLRCSRVCARLLRCVYFYSSPSTDGRNKPAEAINSVACGPSKPCVLNPFIINVNIRIILFKKIKNRFLAEVLWRNNVIILR